MAFHYNIFSKIENNIDTNISEPVFQFLGGIFHQDIETPEAALDEYLEEIPKEEQENDIAALKEFIKAIIRMKKKMILSMKLLTE